MATIKDLKRMCEMQYNHCSGCPLVKCCDLIPMKWEENLDVIVDKWLAIHPEVIRKVNVGAKYRHFKGGVYTALGVAHHSETGEELVIYQRDNDGTEYAGKICARPVGMFLSSVDKVKYPDVEQKFRFEELPEE